MLKKICKLCQKETFSLCWRGSCGPCDYRANKSYWQDYYQQHKKPGKIREHSGCVICYKQIKKTRHVQAKTCSNNCKKVLLRRNLNLYYQKNKEVLSAKQREKYQLRKIQSSLSRKQFSSSNRIEQ